MKKEVIAHKDPKSPISEIFRTLRTNIQFMNTKGKLSTLLITSTLSGEGKSWVSANLAVTFAQAGKKVIILDADMRKGRQFNIFGVSPRPGLSNYLSGVSFDTGRTSLRSLAECVQSTEVQNLFLLPSGNIPPNPSELLSSQKMQNLLVEAKKGWDVVIFDGTPSQLVTDSLILARMVDSTVIVTAAEETKKEDLKRVITNLKNVGGRIAGVVLNKVKVSAKRYNESYYYYGSTTLPSQPTRTHHHKANTYVNKENKDNKENVEKVNPKIEIEHMPERPHKRELYNVEEENMKNIDSLDGKMDLPNKDNDDILNEINKYIDNRKKSMRHH